MVSGRFNAVYHVLLTGALFYYKPYTKHRYFLFYFVRWAAILEEN